MIQGCRSGQGCDGSRPPTAAMPSDPAAAAGAALCRVDGRGLLPVTRLSPLPLLLASSEESFLSPPAFSEPPPGAFAVLVALENPKAPFPRPNGEDPPLPVGEATARVEGDANEL
jgi:hypothetical protein